MRLYNNWNKPDFSFLFFGENEYEYKSLFSVFNFFSFNKSPSNVIEKKILSYGRFVSISNRIELELDSYIGHR